MPSRSALPLCLTLLAACSSYGVAGGERNADFDPADSGATGGDTAEVDDSVYAAWWKLGATLWVSGGAADAAQGGLVLSVLDDTGAELCTAEAAWTALTPEDTPPEDEVLAWWTAVPSQLSGPCADLADAELSGIDDRLGIRDGFQFGLGSLHPELLARLPSAEGIGEGADTALNGAYVSFDEGITTWAFGAAGPEDAYAGATTAATELPLADGAWRFTPLYSFPY